jgi:hypothetical protein
MKNFELPLYLVANEKRSHGGIGNITKAHLVYTCLKEEEYREEAPDLQVLAPQRFFVELGGATFEERLEQVNVDREVESLPKCLDVPLAFASGGNIDRARWLLDDMIENGIIHDSLSEHQEFFERANMIEEAFEQIANAEAENRREEVMRNLRRDN